VSAYRHVYLSPHLDDVALSCGGRIHQLTQAGEPVVVVTVFAASPCFGEGEGSVVSSDYIAALHQRWQAVDDAPALRRAEDETAMRVLGADFFHLSYLDCIYRQHPATGEFLYLSDEDIFARVHPVELALAAKLREELEGLVGAPGEATIYSPLAAGHHVDHQIIVAVALALQLAGYRLAFYEDYPYAETPATLADARRWVGGENWRQELLPLRPQDLAAKIGAVLHYRSQLSTFFDDDKDVAQRLQEYAMTVRLGVPRLSSSSSLSEAPAPHLAPCERIWHLTK
jgi:LmbE family N-acetylglucosaminyl deacetylase